nr:leucine-rich repeat domain-containing protein [uncultured Anaerostipes sp.]
MKKRHLVGIFSCVLSAIMLATPILPVSGSLFSAQRSHEVKADTGTTRSEDWEYKINDTGENTISIVKYYGNETDLKVPDEIDGKTVTEINQKAIDQTSLHTISLPKTLTYIGDSDFSHAKNLTSIEVRDSEYGKTHFWTDENGVLYEYFDHYTEVDQTTYDKYLELLCYPSAKSEKSYTVDDKVTAIAGSAFSNCFYLEEINLGNGVRKLGVAAFKNCMSIQSITIPKNVQKIGYNVAYFCDKLAAYHVDEQNENYCDIDGVLYTKDKSKLVIYPKAKKLTDQIYTVDPACKEIEGMAFDYAAGLKEIKLPDGLTTIGRYAFLCCEQLEKLQIPETVTTIKGALDHITNLRYLYLCGDVPEDFAENERLEETGYSNGLGDQRILTVMINEAYWDNYQAYRESFDKDDGITFEKWDGKTIKPIPSKEPENSNNSNKKPSDNNNSNTKPAASPSVGSVIQTSTTKITQPTAVKLLSVKNQKGKKAQVKWKKNTKASGYQVQYSMKKNFKSGIKNITIKKNKITSTVLKKLKKKKTYYVRVRTYKKLGNKTYYSKWSNVKKVKIKK